MGVMVVKGILWYNLKNMRPDLIFCFVVLIVWAVYAWRHDDLNDWGDH